MAGMFLSFLMAFGAAVRARTTRGVAYTPMSGARLDIYAPAGADGDAPVVVFGPDADRATRHPFRFVGQRLASRGFLAVMPDARADARPSAVLEDLAEAALWAKVNAAAHGGDGRRLFLMGRSSGASDALTLALDGRWLGLVGLEPGDLRGVIGVSGRYDSDRLRSAALAAVPGAPPMLLISGRDDAIDPENTRRMARAIRAVSGQVTEICYPTACDRLGFQGLTSLWRLRASALDEVERFVRLRSLGSQA